MIHTQVLMWMWMCVCVCVCLYVCEWLGLGLDFASLWSPWELAVEGWRLSLPIILI